MANVERSLREFFKEALKNRQLHPPGQSSPTSKHLSIDNRTTKQVAISIIEAIMAILPKLADSASWNSLAIALALSALYMSRKQLFTMTKESIRQIRQVLGRTRPQLDYGHEKNHCEHWLGGFVLC